MIEPRTAENPTVAAIHHAALHQCRLRQPYCPGCHARLAGWFIAGEYACDACQRPVFAPMWRVEPACPYPHQEV